MITVYDTAISAGLCVIFVLTAVFAKALGLLPLETLLLIFAGFAGGFSACTVMARERQDKETG